MRDENQIAFSVLRNAIARCERHSSKLNRPKRVPVKRPKSFYVGLGRLGGLASVATVPPEKRKANGLKGAIARWGTIRDNPLMTKRPNLDMNQLAKRILDEATGEEEKTPAPTTKNRVAMASGKQGGIKGGAARAAKLTPEQRSEIAKKAAAGRWGKP